MAHPHFPPQAALTTHNSEGFPSTAGDQIPAVTQGDSTRITATGTVDVPNLSGHILADNVLVWSHKDFIHYQINPHKVTIPNS